MSTVRIPPVLRQHTDGATEVDAPGSTVGEVLQALVDQHPATEAQLFSNGELNRFVNVYLNDEDVRVLDGLATGVSDADTVMILPAMAGGARERPGSAWTSSTLAGLAHCQQANRVTRSLTPRQPNPGPSPSTTLIEETAESREP